MRAKLLRASVEKDQIILEFSFNQDLVRRIKALPAKDRQWHDRLKQWRLKPTASSIEFVLRNNFKLSDRDTLILLDIIDRLSLQDTIDGAKKQLANAIEAPPIESIAAQMKLPARPCQWVPVHYARLCEGRFLLADSVGVGKSCQALMITLDEAWSDKPVMIVTPVPTTFQYEIQKFLGKPAVILDKDWQQPTARYRYYLCTYERLKQLVDVVHRNGREVLIPKPFVEDMFFIFDEAHNLKNPGTLRNKRARAIARYVKHLVLMTGTPVMNRPSEAYQLLRLLKPNFMDWMTFMQRYCNMLYRYGGRIDTTGASNLSHLREYMYKNVLVRREKSQIQTQLPPVEYQAINILDQLVDIEADSIFALASESAIQKAADPKFREYIETLIDETDKLVLFGYHQPMLNALEGICRALGKEFIRIDGNTPMNSRHDLTMRFKDDPKCQVAILSSAAAGTGINNLQVAQVCMVCELPWSPGILEQMIGRLHRSGQMGSVLALFAIYSRWDQALAELILRKHGIIERIVGIEEVPDTLDESLHLKALARQFGITLGRKAS